jgi:hypothetical protein
LYFLTANILAPTVKGVEAMMNEGWLKFDYGAYSRQWTYSQIESLLLVEEFIESQAESDDGVPWDYKFFVFDRTVQ